MIMASFKDFLDVLKEDLSELGKQQLQEHADALLKDGQDFAKEAEEDLKKWTQQLAAGEMSGNGFKMAVAGKAELAQMEALKQAGLAAIRVDKLKQGILDTVVAAATKTFLP
jgi:hypothetical protein